MAFWRSYWYAGYPVRMATEKKKKKKYVLQLCVIKALHNDVSGF